MHRQRKVNRDNNHLKQIYGDAQSMTARVKQMDADVQSLSEIFSIDANGALQQTQ